ncbi:MAG: histidine kinase dimerization/phospho-acceptor domain-containing protein, partial [Candidatus Sulfotelmatobacter sp.]
MSTATRFSWSEVPTPENTETGFHSVFERAPIAAARCNSQGVIVEVNLAFEQAVNPLLLQQRVLRLSDLVPPEDRGTTESLLRALLNSTCDSIRVEGREKGSATDGTEVIHWTAWRLPALGGELPHALLIAERNHEAAPVKEDLLQTQRWEAVGRLAGGVVHDFNNLLTGVMLYCDLLLSSMDTRDCRRRYAAEIRAAVVQAAGLVRQLLVSRAHKLPKSVRC